MKATAIFLACMEWRLAFTVAAAGLLLAGCGRPDIEVPSAAAPSSVASVPTPAPATPPRRFTTQDWLSTFRATFETRDPRKDGEGITDFAACFKRDPSKKNGCGLFAFGRSDAFQKMHFLTPSSSRLNDIADLNTFIKVSIAAPECESPKLALMPRYNSENGWLFIEKVAVMADGQMVLEHAFERHEVKTNVDGRWVQERAIWVADAHDLQALRQISSAQSGVTRLTGEKGYITIKPALHKGFVDDVRDALSMMDTLEKAFASAGGATCTGADRS